MLSLVVVNYLFLSLQTSRSKLLLTNQIKRYRLGDIPNSDQYSNKDIKESIILMLSTLFKGVIL